jgi:hypothetical protein
MLRPSACPDADARIGECLWEYMVKLLPGGDAVRIRLSHHPRRRSPMSQARRMPAGLHRDKRRFEPSPRAKARENVPPNPCRRTDMT